MRGEKTGKTGKRRDREKKCRRKKKEDEILCREKLEWIECERSNQVQLDSRKTRKGEGEETKERKSCERLSDKKKVRGLALLWILLQKICFQMCWVSSVFDCAAC